MTSISKYEYMKQTSIDPELICNICTDLLQQPMSTSCKHIFCKQCIERWLENGGKSCPICRHSLSIQNLIPVTTQSILNRLQQIRDQCIKNGPTGLKPVPIAYPNQRLERQIALCAHNSTVCLAEQKLTDQDMLIVVQQAIINKKCEKLWLTQNEIGSDGALILANALYGNTSLRELSLNNNHVSDIGVYYLVSVLSRSNSSVRTLSLSSNHLTDDSAQYLATLLQTNTTLTRLWLNGNQIGDRGVQLFSNVLARYNTTFEVLSLSSNMPVSDSSVDAIADMLKYNQSLKSFHINTSGLSSAAKTILKKIANSKTNFFFAVY